ncbi:MAG TPA: tetratricopeptide repeat protein [Candidatus Acidoferrales bacterium]|jgi:Flp pilus assembly protein TadD|nr:tetratricopeptide repeat protein [Candidatus Acidoferrales bacterium]
MSDNKALIEFKQGVRRLRESQPHDALQHFRNAADLEKNNPYFLSFVGVSLARAERKWAPALTLCEAALSMKRNDAQLYLNLAEVYTAAGRREEALLTLDRARASLGPVARVQQARLKLGQRRSPALPFLDRQNVLNRQLGIWRHRILAWMNASRSEMVHSS